jgi:LysM repeat protein
VGHTHGVISRLRPGPNGRGGATLAIGPALGILVAVTVALAGCGRSAPEGASAVTGDGTEPVSAGIRVASEQTVVAPAPTTVPPPTTAATTVAPATQPAGRYVVEPGDTLSLIAGRFGVTVDALSQANGITDPNSIRPGQELIIPGAG